MEKLIPTLTTMGKLIAIEDVEKLWRYKHAPDVMEVYTEGRYITLDAIYYLPQIDTEDLRKGFLKEVVGEIEKMIGENEFGKGIDYSEDYCKGLKELLQKFKS